MSTPTLVIGRSGQVATALAACGQSSRFPSLEVATLARPDLDLSDPERAAATLSRAVKHMRPNAVINAAAYTAVDKAEDEEDLALRINADAPGAMAQVTRDADIPFLHLSTDYVFDGNKAGAYHEDDPTGPTGAYGRSKRAGEAAVMAANPDAMIFRTAWVYSAGGHNFVRTMLRLARDRDHVSVVDDQVGSPSYADDIAAALLTVAQSGPKAGGVYHLAGGGQVSWYGFARAIFAASKDLGGPYAEVTPIATRDYPTPAKRPANSVLNSDKADRTFGVRLPDWQNGLKRCMTALKDAGELA